MNRDTKNIDIVGSHYFLIITTYENYCGKKENKKITFASFFKSWLFKRIALNIVWLAANLALISFGAVWIVENVPSLFSIWLCLVLLYSIVYRALATGIFDLIIGYE